VDAERFSLFLALKKAAFHSFAMGISRCCFVSLALLISGYSAKAHAQAFVFDTGNTTLVKGTGEKIIGLYFPQLSGQGLGPTLEAQIQPSINALSNSLKSQVETRLNALDFAPFVKHTATAGAAAARGNTVDHASFIKLFSLTGSGSVALSDTTNLGSLRDPSTLTNNIANGIAPVSGVAPGAGAMLGFNFGALRLPRLGFFDVSRLQLYVSAMHLNFTYDGDDIKADTSNYGAHVKYQVIAPNNLLQNTLVRWGGLNVATGLTYASTNLAFHTSLPSGDLQQDTPVTVAGVQQTLQLRGLWTGEADINAHLRAYTMPLEVSSFLQLLYVFTLFGGIGMDLNFGHAEMNASARAPLTITASAKGQNKTVEVLKPQPQLDYLLIRKPTVIDGRAFAGLQLNAGVLAVYAQGMVDTSKTLMVNAGLRAFY
jgi:hypothetical protein